MICGYHHFFFLIVCSTFIDFVGLFHDTIHNVNIAPSFLRIHTRVNEWSNEILFRVGISVTKWKYDGWRHHQMLLRYLEFAEGSLKKSSRKKKHITNCGGSHEFVWVDDVRIHCPNPNNRHTTRRRTQTAHPSTSPSAHHPSVLSPLHSSPIRPLRERFSSIWNSSGSSIFAWHVLLWKKDYHYGGRKESVYFQDTQPHSAKSIDDIQPTEARADRTYAQLEYLRGRPLAIIQDYMQTVIFLSSPAVLSQLVAETAHELLVESRFVHISHHEHHVLYSQVFDEADKRDCHDRVEEWNHRARHHCRYACLDFLFVMFL